MTRTFSSKKPFRERYRERVITVGLQVFFIAFILRAVAVIITTLFNVNPESRYDAQVFASAADAIATGLLQGQLVTPGPNPTYDIWGAFLSPFWLLPGPSILYARLGNAFLGAFAIYNVYLIARYYHSRRAGVIATIPLIFYPSIVAVHSTVLREAIVLFGITTAARLVMVQSQRNRDWPIYMISILFLYVAYIQRSSNWIIYIASIGAGMGVYVSKSEYLSKKLLGAVAGFSPLFVVVLSSFIQAGVEYLSRIREIRGGGRTDYLINIIPETFPEFAAFSWIGATYFLYSPFPWMVETLPDVIVSIEGLITIGFTISAFFGIRLFAREDKSATTALVVGLLLAVVFYGVGTVNFGTGMRHRQMFTWIIFLFGGVGIAEHIQFIGLPRASRNHESQR